MSMSRKFYEDIAARFKEAMPEPERDSYGFPTSAAHHTWQEMVRVTADSITAQGATFNRSRFYEACGLNVTPAP